MLRALLTGRVTLTLAAMAVLVLAWNVYVSQHDAGLLTGSVVDRNGRAVAGATVTLSALSQINRNVIAVTTTAADGRFTFTAHGSHAMYIEAEKADVGHSRRQEIRLYFRDQDRTLDRPLLLDPDIKRGPKLAPLQN